jgi:cell division septation protein DedD
MVNKPAPSPIRISDYKENDTRIRGYVIQVAAISKKKVDFTPFKYYLSKYGEIFVSRRDDNLIRIMVGIYEDKDSAEDALLKIREEKFKEAFITPLPMNIKLDSVEEYAKNDSGSNKSEFVKENDDEAVEEYMVNLGQFNNMIWFDNKEVESIGLIEERKENGKIVVLLSGYTSRDEAKRALEKVKKLGYKNAQVVKNGKGGKLIPVK